MTLDTTQLRELAEAATPGPCPGCGLSMRDEPPPGACDYGGHAMYQPLLDALYAARAALSDPRIIADRELAEACERLDALIAAGHRVQISAWPDAKTWYGGDVDGPVRCVTDDGNDYSETEPTLSALIVALAGRT